MEKIGRCLGSGLFTGDGAKMTDWTEADWNPKPTKWSLIQFTLLSVATVGYSGFTSFPHYIFKHTGHFLVPFYLLLVVIGVPVCYVQLKIGALYRRGVVATFAHIVPILKGIAVALLIMTYFRSITHALELSYGLVYMFASLRQPFPWDVQPSDNVSREEAKITIFSSSPEDRYFV